MKIFCLDSIIDGVQLVTRGIKTAMDTDSPDDLNPEDNGKIEEFAHAHLTSDEPGFKMFVQTAYDNGKIKTSEVDWFDWALKLRAKYEDRPIKELMKYIHYTSKKKNKNDQTPANVSARNFIAVI